MNYRHAFHAGNFADVVKHALLVWLLDALARKSRPFLVLDTHAGAGFTDLDGEPATRTGEWRAGIGCLLPLPLREGVGSGSAPGSVPPRLLPLPLREGEKIPRSPATWRWSGVSASIPARRP